MVLGEGPNWSRAHVQAPQFIPRRHLSILMNIYFDFLDKYKSVSQNLQIFILIKRSPDLVDKMNDLSTQESK